MKELLLRKVNAATRTSMTVFSCASLLSLLAILHCIESIKTNNKIHRASIPSPDNFQGFGLDRENILFDGRGEFDYLRGEPPKVIERNNEKQIDASSDNTNIIEWETNAKKSDVKIASGSVHYRYTNINYVETDKSLSYLHCNTKDSFSNELKAQALHGWILPPPDLQSKFQKERFNEILLLHEVRHPANEWSESGILHQLCIDGFRAVLQDEKNNAGSTKEQPYVSVTVIDLDPTANGLDLHHAIINLKKNNVLSGRPLTVVSPVESGKTVINLGAYASEVVPDAPEEEFERQVDRNGATRRLRNVALHLPNQTNSNERRRLQITSDLYHPGALLLTHMVHTWISIAPLDALESSAEALRAFLLANINVLSIYEVGDVWGKRAAERLETTAGARSVGMNGSYLKNPEKFVEIVSNLLY